MEWYTASTGNHQGLICERETGRNVAVSYDKTDAQLIAAAPELLEACKTTLDIINSYSHIPAQFEACRVLQQAIANAEES